MRFKFRAWDKNQKKWYDKVTVGCDGVGNDYISHSVYSDEQRRWLSFDDGCGTVVQWTGEKGIYEHDIVKKGENVGVVKYSNDYCRFYVDWAPPVEFGLRSELWYVRDDLEVIGNIYENPELIGR